MIILGLGYGDEGKGLSTSFICSKTKKPIVVRFNGGHQAGHTVVFNKRRHVFSSFGAGSLQNVPTFWSQYCTFFPTAVVNEFLSLRLDAKLFVHPLCPVTTPYDLYYNQEQNKILKHGSVGVGFGATLQRHESFHKLYVQDLFYEKVLLEKLRLISKYYHNYSISIDHFLEDVEMAKKIIEVCDNDILRKYNPIFEGAQGILLDQDFGFFPHVTRSNTTSKNALQLYPSQEIYYVTRTYQTRHGNGFLSNEHLPISLTNNDHETNSYNDHQGVFRHAPLDVEMINYAMQCDGHFSQKLKKNLIITCMDQNEIMVDKLLSQINLKFNKVYLSFGDSLDFVKEYN